MLLQFLHPKTLWFLLILLIPIIIHLFNFKRFKKIYFSNLRFLQNLNIENKRKSKLKNLLILLLRMLALACIVIAFAQPYVPLSNQLESKFEEKQFITIYIDNSFSMNGKTEKGNALEVAKNHAFELVKSLPDYSRLRVYSNDIKHYSNSLNKNQAIARIQEIEPSPVSIPLSELLKNIRIDLAASKAQVYVLSDFQKSQADFDQLKADSLLQVDFVQLDVQPTNNLVLDSCWFETPHYSNNEPKELFVKVSNHSNSDLKKIPLQLSINDSIKAVASIDISKNSSHETTLRYTDKYNKSIQAKLSIEDYPISYDNHLYFSYENIDRFKVLSINQEATNEYINKLFESDETFEIKNIGNSELHNESLNQYQLIVLNETESIESGFKQSIKTFLLKGGNVLFIPGDRLSASLNSFLSEINAPNYQEIDSTKQRISTIERQAEIYKNVFQELKNNARLPDIFKYYKLTNPNNNRHEVLWQTAGGESLFSKSMHGKGNFYQFGMNLKSDWTNLITHPILVPSIVNLCKSNATGNEIYYEIGKNSPIKIDVPFSVSGEEQFHILNNRIGVDVIPQKSTGADQSTLLQNPGQITIAENYHISVNDSMIQNCSFNYSRVESDLSYHNLSEIESKIKPLGGNYSAISSEKMKLSELNNEKRDGRQLWRIFILLAVVFFLIEGILKL
ncbi:vWA domain-containing protein [Marinifilum caeruleilacunae]|uniref:VWA domain-containing protein n=1 Tax=Marinifilum caeruleilacunae TaxID=2499076 RepID=A0ABX1X1U4_9BACT|nr:VWA domain-containing protein [Marinifilum caeruleilacunae]NOU62196.1 VWA domain-containing protein [Marinifilum caeruleilacunae]